MKRKKTIIFLAPTPPPYMGPTIATKIILRSEFVREFNVVHIDTCDRRPLSYIGKFDFINIYLSIKHYLQLLQKLISSNATLVYIPLTQTSVGFLRDFPFMVLAKLFKKRVVLHLRGGYFRRFYDDSSSIMKIVIRKTVQKSNRIIVLGYSLRDLFKGLISEEKLSVVPNGLNLKFEPKNRANGGKFIVLFLSNFAESKGYKDVLYSVKKVSQASNKIRYIFAGSWMSLRDKHEFTRYLEKEKIDKYVELVDIATGKKKISLFEHADVFAFPTYYSFEGHPWVIVEAMAAGLPIITTDAGCIRESVIDGQNGFIIPPRNSDAVAEKIIYLIEHPEERQRMGFTSRRFYEDKFTEEHFVKAMIQAIHCALNSS